jgi:hypothetical protein
MAQFLLEVFQCHGVKRGDAFAFDAGDISLKVSELEIDDLRSLQNLIHEEDKTLHEMISTALDRSGELSVHGGELELKYNRLPPMIPAYYGGIGQ